ncbi:MAG: thioredoxin domain-containing protein [Candidatus Doudnabacteria bacterium]|nr:thioredoxin domain-containing protein [Candidatus Doudnabacteria bacterium]
MNKKTSVIITVVVVLFLAFGFLLYKISPPPVSALKLKEFDFSQVKQVDRPRDVTAEDHVRGNREAKNTLVVYEDIQCPACRAFNPTLQQLPSLLKDTKVVFRHYPLYPTPHMNALSAAYASEAAGAQGKFWEFVDMMYERQNEWSNEKNPLEKMVEIAAAAGVSNIEQFKKDILESKYSEKIQADNFEAVGVGADATPTLMFNGTKIKLTSGTLEDLTKQVEPLYIK